MKKGPEEELPLRDTITTAIDVYARAKPTQLTNPGFMAVCWDRQSDHYDLDMLNDGFIKVESAPGNPNTTISEMTGGDPTMMAMCWAARLFWCSKCVNHYNNIVAEPTWHGTVESRHFFRFIRILQLRDAELPLPMELLVMIYRYLLPSRVKLPKLEYEIFKL